MPRRSDESMLNLKLQSGGPISGIQAVLLAEHLGGQVPLGRRIPMLPVGW
jgi:hypothetical protein